MRAVIYARYSSDNQREESIEGQIRECTEYAEYNDREVGGAPETHRHVREQRLSLRRSSENYL